MYVLHTYSLEQTERVYLFKNQVMKQ